MIEKVAKIMVDNKYWLRKVATGCKVLLNGCKQSMVVDTACLTIVYNGWCWALITDKLLLMMMTDGWSLMIVNEWSMVAHGGWKLLFVIVDENEWWSMVVNDDWWIFRMDSDIDVKMC